MKKSVLAIALAATVLSACGTKTIIVQQEASTTTQVKSTTSVPKKEEPALSSEDTFVNNVISEYPNLLNTFGRKWLIDFAQSTCTSIDEGMTLDDLVAMATKFDVDTGMVGFITGEAIRNFCPRNQWFIDAAINA